MLLIDRLIHVWYWQTTHDHLLGRPAGVNLIEGSRRQVLTFLDSLRYGPGSTAGTHETHEAWRATWRHVRVQHHAAR